jgi:LacI family transcriptional regulator, galactose operon repressor
MTRDTPKFLPCSNAHRSARAGRAPRQEFPREPLVPWDLRWPHGARRCDPPAADVLTSPTTRAATLKHAAKQQRVAAARFPINNSERSVRRFAYAVGDGRGEPPRPPMKGKPGVTVREVAERAGVHPGTVSRVLNPQTRHRISDATARRVEQAVEALGYQVNSMARALRTRRSCTVGVVIPDLTNPTFPPVIRGVEDYLHPRGYTALLTNTDSDPEREIRGLEALAARQVDGFIVAATNAALQVVKRMIERDVPVVLINRSIAGVQGFAVTPDDRRGAACAVDHLFALGHRAIAHLGGPRGLSPGQERYLGYEDSMRDHGIDDAERLAAFADTFNAGAGVAPTAELLEREPAFTAVFAANDLLALDCIDTLQSAGLACPRDVSVIGFNDMPFADAFTPPLTTIRFSHYEIGRRAAEMLLSQIRGDGSAPRTLVLPTELVERASTAALSGGHLAAGDRESDRLRSRSRPELPGRIADVDAHGDG